MTFVLNILSWNILYSFFLNFYVFPGHSFIFASMLFVDYVFDLL